MSKGIVIGRWIAALIAAIVIYVVALKVLVTVEGGISAISATLRVFNTALIAACLALVAGCFIVPRAQIMLGRKYFFALAVLGPVIAYAWVVYKTGAFHNTIPLVLAGNVAGGVIGLFIMILPKPARVSQGRQFS